MVSNGNGNGLRLLLAARKSRKASADEVATQYERQDHRAQTWAEREGHGVVNSTADTVSSQTAPWKRRNLKPWMTDPAKLALYDALLISDTDRLSRGTDEDFHYIEDWCYRNGKRIVVADGPQFPPRDGAMGESDRYQWIAQKRAARTYWEAVRDKHADTREVIRANQKATGGKEGVIGRAPFGYVITGLKLHKTFVIDPVNGPLAKEAFRRIAGGRTATGVAIWLSEQTGKQWRVKRVTDMIQRRTYLGERDGHTFKPLVTEELWNDANAMLATRSFSHKTGGRAVVHGYSGHIYCECGAVYYRHKSERGREKYRCGRGRSGDLTESRCGRPGLDFGAVNEAVDRAMRAVKDPEWVTMTRGGDHGKQQALAALKEKMNTAMAAGDMPALTSLAAEYEAVDAKPSEPVVTFGRFTGRYVNDVWAVEGLSGRRALLVRYPVVVTSDLVATVQYEGDDEAEDQEYEAAA